MPVQHTTLAEVNGPATYFVLAIPVAVAGLPLLFRSRAVRILSAVLITGWVVIGAASIGLVYIPSAVMMVCSSDVCLKLPRRYFCRIPFAPPAPTPLLPPHQQLSSRWLVDQFDPPI